MGRKSSTRSSRRASPARHHKAVLVLLTPNVASHQRGSQPPCWSAADTREHRAASCYSGPRRLGVAALAGRWMASPAGHRAEPLEEGVSGGAGGLLVQGTRCAHGCRPLEAGTTEQDLAARPRAKSPRHPRLTPRPRSSAKAKHRQGRITPWAETSPPAKVGHVAPPPLCRSPLIHHRWQIP